MLRRLEAGDAGNGDALDQHLARVREKMQRALEQQRALQDQLLPRRGLGDPSGGRVPALPRFPVGPGERLRDSLSRDEPRLGVQVEPPGAALADQLDLPENQGLVLSEVTPDSPAARVGLKTHDVLLELNGKPVPSDAQQFAGCLAAIEANQPVDVVVLRKGRRETLKGLTLPEAKVDRAEQSQRPAPVPAAPRLDLFRRGIPDAHNQIGSRTSLVRNKDAFHILHKDGPLRFTVIGTLVDGRPTVRSVMVADGPTTHLFDSLEKVPAEFREKIRALLSRVQRDESRP
jgi:hypothetical protein